MVMISLFSRGKYNSGVILC